MINALKQARAAFAMLSPDDIRNRAARPVTFGLVAASAPAFDEMEDFLASADRGLVFRAGLPGVPEQVDLVLYQDGAVGPKGTYMFNRSDPKRTASEIVREHDDLAPALARAYPAFREPVVDRVIQSIARENAFFSIATALPDVIPSLVELPWALGEFASDTAFLTANQIRMAFLIAAACGRPVGLAHQKAEIAGIAAGAFGWRAIARELTGKIPFGGGLIPKAAIAYAGTFAVGKALAYYHDAGKPLTRQERKAVYLEGLEKGKRVAESIASSES